MIEVARSRSERRRRRSEPFGRLGVAARGFVESPSECPAPVRSALRAQGSQDPAARPAGRSLLHITTTTMWVLILKADTMPIQMPSNPQLPLRDNSQLKRARDSPSTCSTGFKPLAAQMSAGDAHFSTRMRFRFNSLDSSPDRSRHSLSVEILTPTQRQYAPVAFCSTVGLG